MLIPFYLYAGGEYILSEVNTNCPERCLVQLSCWNLLLWTIYFLFNIKSNIFLFIIISLQFTVSIGKLIQDLFYYKDLSKQFYNLFCHYINLIIAICLIPSVKSLAIKQLLFIYLLAISYTVYYVIMAFILSKCHLPPEPEFSPLESSGRVHIAYLLLFFIIISQLLNYIVSYIKYR